MDFELTSPLAIIYDTLDKILGYLSVRELYEARIICKTFYSLVVNTPSTWAHYFESHNIVFINEKVRKLLLSSPQDCFVYIRFRITSSVLTEFIELQLKDGTGFIHQIPPIQAYFQYDVLWKLFYENNAYCKINYICSERKDVFIRMNGKDFGLEDYVNICGIKGGDTLYFNISHFKGYTEYLEKNGTRAEYIEFEEDEEGFSIYLEDIWKTMCFTILDTRIEWPSHSYKQESILTLLFSYFMERKNGREYVEKTWSELFEYYEKTY